MRDDPDFDFDDEDDGPDEVLDTGPRRTIPQWAVALAVAVVLFSLFIYAVVHGNHVTPSAGPSSTAPPSAAPTLVAPTVPPAPPAVTAVSADYAVIPDDADLRLYELIDDRLVSVNMRNLAQTMSPVVRTGGPDDSNDALAFDAKHDIVWVVPQSPGGNSSGSTGVLEGFDGRTMRLVDRMPLVGPESAAAVLDGQLYLLGDHRLLRVDPRRKEFAILARTDSSAVSLTADPARHQLLIFENGQTPEVRAYSRGRLGRPAVLPFNQGDVTVAGSTIWALGSTAGTAVLTRLDPRTLGAGANLARQAGLSSTDVLDSTGAHSLYATNYAGTRLSCLSGTTGQLRHRFPRIRGTFVSVHGVGYAASPRSLQLIPMGRCRG